MVSFTKPFFRKEKKKVQIKVRILVMGQILSDLRKIRRCRQEHGAASYLKEEQQEHSQKELYFQHFQIQVALSLGSMSVFVFHFKMSLKERGTKFVWLFFPVRHLSWAWGVEHWSSKALKQIPVEGEGNGRGKNKSVSKESRERLGSKADSFKNKNKNEVKKKINGFEENKCRKWNEPIGVVFLYSKLTAYK